MQCVGIIGKQDPAGLRSGIDQPWHSRLARHVTHESKAILKQDSASHEQDAGSCVMDNCRQAHEIWLCKHQETGQPRHGYLKVPMGPEGPVEGWPQEIVH